MKDPFPELSSHEVKKGLALGVTEGMLSESMTALTGGTLLIALAISLGASNFQIGFLAALPTLTNIFQLGAVWLVQRYQNRRKLTVIATIVARFPLVMIGLIPVVFSAGTSINMLLFLLFFHYMFASIGGATWNSWMKDLVPEQQLGSYFSHRTRMMQLLNVCLSIVLALLLDHFKIVYPGSQQLVYGCMFIAGGILGLTGSYLLSKTPEPSCDIMPESLVSLFNKPLRDKNFRKFLFFNASWSFALNLATPFFTVFMMNELMIPLSYVIALTIMGQIAGIFAVKIWGRFSDQFSNKTIIRIAAPLYVACIIGWSFVSVLHIYNNRLIMIAVISTLSGVATSGINLAISNIGIKLATKNLGIAYLSVRNMVVAFATALAPIAGGCMADYFAARKIDWAFQWTNSSGTHSIHLLSLHTWGFLFIIGGNFALLTLQILKRVREQGEINRSTAMTEMRVVFRKRMNTAVSKKSILELLVSPVQYPLVFTRKIIAQFGKTNASRRRA